MLFVVSNNGDNLFLCYIKIGLKLLDSILGWSLPQVIVMMQLIKLNLNM